MTAETCSDEVAGYAVARRIEPDDLAQIPLFSELSAMQGATVAAALHRREVPPRATVMAVEQRGESISVIVQGTVKVHVETAAGEDVVLAILGPGEVLGEMSVVDSLGHSASVTAVEHCTLFSLDRSSFLEFLRTMPALAYNLTTILSRRLRLANVQIQSLATLDVPGRVARQILALANEYGEPVENGGVRIPIRLTQAELAGLIGGSRVRVNQALIGFRRGKVISMDREYRIVVHDAAALSRRCQ